MAHSSILGADQAATQAPGRDADALGPSDSSDSGSDIQGELDLAGDGDQLDPLGPVLPQGRDTSDSAGTGERASAIPDESVRDAADIAPDRIRSLSEEALASDPDSFDSDAADEVEQMLPGFELAGEEDDIDPEQGLSESDGA